MKLSKFFKVSFKVCCAKQGLNKYIAHLSSVKVTKENSIFL